MFKRFLTLLAALVAGAVVHAGAAQAQTVSTPPWPGAIGWNGLMFDVTATNALTVNTVVSGVQAAGTFEIYGRSGTHVGFEGSSAGWTLLGAGVAPTTGAGQLTVPVAVAIPAGQSYAFYISGQGGARGGYETGTAVGSVAASDANLSLLDGSAVNLGFGGVAFTPRRLAGSITYTAVPVVTVPTLSEWAMIGFGVLLLGAGFLAVNRRRFAL